jgi:hypothetical protein
VHAIDDARGGAVVKDHHGAQGLGKSDGFTPQFNSCGDPLHPRKPIVQEDAHALLPPSIRVVIE